MANEAVDRLLVEMIGSAEGISDLNFTVGRPPQVEVYGELKPADLASPTRSLTAKDTELLANALIGDNQELLTTLKRTGACDCAYSTPDGTRFRVNIFSSKGHRSVVLRSLHAEVPDLDDLGLPEAVQRIPEQRDGLVLVTGATGSGKSTTLAAIVDRINAIRPVHIVTLEDPIEFLHPHKKGTVNQREMGTDFHRYSDGLRAALRQAPKVILVGEMRDRETVEIALKAAETGHLVLGTMHTVDAGQTLNRIGGMFEFNERPLVRNRLAEVLRFVIGQRLLPREGGGRVPAMEIMTSCLRVRELIQNGEEGDKTFYKVIAEGGALGMQTFDQHILHLYRDEAISQATAKGYCTDATSVRQEIDRIRTRRGEETSDLGELEMAHGHRSTMRSRTRRR